MVGSPCAAVSQDLAQLLVQAGLMKRYTCTYTNGKLILTLSSVFFLTPLKESCNNVYL